MTVLAISTTPWTRPQNLLGASPSVIIQLSKKVFAILVLLPLILMLFLVFSEITLARFA